MQRFLRGFATAAVRAAPPPPPLPGQRRTLLRRVQRTSAQRCRGTRGHAPPRTRAYATANPAAGSHGRAAVSAWAEALRRCDASTEARALVRGLTRRHVDDASASPAPLNALARELLLEGRPQRAAAALDAVSALGLRADEGTEDARRLLRAGDAADGELGAMRTAALRRGMSGENGADGVRRAQALFARLLAIGAADDRHRAVMLRACTDVDEARAAVGAMHRADQARRARDEGELPPPPPSGGRGETELSGGPPAPAAPPPAPAVGVPGVGVPGVGVPGVGVPGVGVPGVSEATPADDERDAAHASASHAPLDDRRGEGAWATRELGRLLSAGARREAHSLFADLVAAGRADARHANVMLAACPDPAQARALLARLPAAGIAPDAASHNTLMHQLILHGRVAEAEAVVDEMARAGLPPDAVTERTLALTRDSEALSRARRAALERMVAPADAGGVGGSAIDDAGLDASGGSTFARGSRAARDPEGAMALFDAILDAGEANEIHGGVALRAHDGPDHARAVIDRMRAAGLPPSARCHNQLIKRLLVFGREAEAEAAVDAMWAEGLEPDEHTSRAFALDRGTLDRMRRAAVRRMRERRGGRASPVPRVQRGVRGPPASDPPRAIPRAEGRAGDATRGSFPAGAAPALQRCFSLGDDAAVLRRLRALVDAGGGARVVSIRRAPPQTTPPQTTPPRRGAGEPRDDSDDSAARARTGVRRIMRVVLDRSAHGPTAGGSAGGTPRSAQVPHANDAPETPASATADDAPAGIGASAALVGDGGRAGPPPGPPAKFENRPGPARANGIRGAPRNEIRNSDDAGGVSTWTEGPWTEGPWTEARRAGSLAALVRAARGGGGGAAMRAAQEHLASLVLAGRADAEHCNVAVAACANPEEAEEMVALMTAAGVAPNAGTWVSLVRQHLVAGDRAGAERAVARAGGAGPAGSHFSGSHAARGRRAAAAAEALARPAADVSRLRTAKLRALHDEGRSGAARALFRRLVEAGVVDKFQCTAMLAAGDGPADRRALQRELREAGYAFSRAGGEWTLRRVDAPARGGSSPGAAGGGALSSRDGTRHTGGGQDRGRGATDGHGLQA